MVKVRTRALVLTLGAAITLSLTAGLTASMAADPAPGVADAEVKPAAAASTAAVADATSWSTYVSLGSPPPSEPTMGMVGLSTTA